MNNVVNRLYAWACERLYAELAGSYNIISWLVSFGHWDRWRLLTLDYLQGVHVLELGFGTGELLPHLAARSALAVGLDLSLAMHQQAKRKLTKLGLSLPLVQARAQTLPFADQTFDTIIATFPAPYILEQATLTECVRVLTPLLNNGTSRGRLVIVGLWVTPGRSTWARLLPLFYGRPVQAVLDHVAARLAAVGLEPMLTERTVGLFKVGVIVAERK
jgi:ubiquinone/menaquinone biosynthesis C-methylase UbiE